MGAAACAYDVLAAQRQDGGLSGAFPNTASILHGCHHASSHVNVERVIRIELTYDAWEAPALPLSYTRDSLESEAQSGWQRPRCQMRCGQIVGGIGGIMNARFMPPRP